MVLRLNLKPHTPYPIPHTLHPYTLTPYTLHFTSFLDHPADPLPDPEKIGAGFGHQPEGLTSHALIDIFQLLNYDFFIKTFDRIFTDLFRIVFFGMFDHFFHGFM